jgi:hypothetical protein
MNRLREQGADRVLTVGQPSFSLPGWTVIGTGAWQEQSGVTTNFTTDMIALDTLFLSAKRAGLSTGLVGHEQWGQLYAEGVDVERLTIEADDAYTNLEGDLEFDRETADLALEVLAEQPDFTLIHLLSVDSAAHGWGPLSDEGQAAVANADEQLARIVDAIDLSNTAVLVTADHGHIDRGGHGGWEDTALRIPLVSAGQGIVQGEYAPGTQADIAPTAAALLGISIPAHNQGTLLLDQVEMTDALKAAWMVVLAQQVTQRYDSMLATIGESRRVERTMLDAAETALEAGDIPPALSAATQALDVAHELWATAREERINRERVAKLPVALVMVIPLALYLWWWRREGWNWRAPLVGMVIYLVLWNGVYFVVEGHTYSISMFNVESQIVAFITNRVLVAVGALVVAVSLVAVLRWRAPAGEIARDAVHTMLLVAAVLGVQILAYAVVWEILPAWYLPDLLWGFKYYLDLYQTTVFWPLTPLPLAAIVPVFALVIGLVARRVLGRTRRQK